MNQAYEKALEQAETDLTTLDTAAEELERKRAKVRQTILVLRSMLGLDVDDSESLTDAILNVLKASDSYMTGPEVADRLIMAGFQVQIATVATILSRLAKENQLEKRPEGGYRWAGIPHWTKEFGEGLAKTMAEAVENPETVRPKLPPASRVRLRLREKD